MQASSLDEAHLLLDAAWREEQERCASAAQQLQDLKRERRRCVEAEAAPTTRGSRMLLQHPRYTQVFKGR